MTKRRNAFGKYLRQQRVAADISLRGLAKKLGVSHVYLGEVERGKRGPLSEKHWPVLVENVEGITMNDLRVYASNGRPVQLNLRNAPESQINLVHALARRIRKANLQEHDVEELLRVLRRDDDG